MNCNDFIKIMPKFIDESMDETDYDEFVTHVKECPECKDELEIHYMIQVGLERIENDSGKSFDIPKELENQLIRYEERADILFRREVYKKVIFYIANICAGILAAFNLLMILWKSVYNFKIL